MAKDIESERWIEVRMYVFGVSTKKVSSTEKALTDIAKKTGFIIGKEKQKSSNNFDVFISPKGLISPLELESELPTLMENVKKISKHFHIHSKQGRIFIETPPEDNFEAMKNREMMKLFQNILVFRFKLRNRIILEESNFYLANNIFRTSLYFDFEPINPFRKFLNKISPMAENMSREKVRRQLYGLCLMKDSRRI